MRRKTTTIVLSVLLLTISPAASFVTSAAGPALTPASLASLQSGCPIPIRVTLTELRTEQSSGSDRGRSIYKVDWEMTGNLPGGVTQMSAFEVSVQDPLGLGTTTVQGSARTATVRVEHTATYPNIRVAPYATVKGIAQTGICDTRLSYRPSGITVTPPGLVGCSVVLVFMSTPTVVQTFRPGVGGTPFPDGFGVKTDWTISAPLVFCLTIKKFELSVTVEFPDGSRRNRLEFFDAATRTSTLKVGDSPILFNRPTIVEVRLNPVTEVKLFGQSEIRPL